MNYSDWLEVLNAACMFQAGNRRPDVVVLPCLLNTEKKCRQKKKKKEREKEKNNEKKIYGPSFLTPCIRILYYLKSSASSDLHRYLIDKKNISSTSYIWDSLRQRSVDYSSWFENMTMGTRRRFLRALRREIFYKTFPRGCHIVCEVKKKKNIFEGRHSRKYHLFKWKVFFSLYRCFYLHLENNQKF